MGMTKTWNNYPDSSSPDTYQVKNLFRVNVFHSFDDLAKEIPALGFRELVVLNGKRRRMRL